MIVRKRSWPAVSHYPQCQPDLRLNRIKFVWTHNLKFHSLAIELDCPDLKVHSDRRDVALGVCIVRKPQEQTGLSHTGVTDKKEFEQVIVPTRISDQRLQRNVVRSHEYEGKLEAARVVVAARLVGSKI